MTSVTWPVEPTELSDFLRAPNCYTHHDILVEVKETHLSWVFLTDRFAYKLKKPVCFDFVDLRTPEQRRRACEQELCLNRRLAPDVYLQVLSVKRDRHLGLRLEGDGKVVDWLVKMRRLPADRSLDYLITHGTINDYEVAELARFLGNYYAQRPPLMIRPEEYRKALTRQVASNIDTLSPIMQGAAAQLLQFIGSIQIHFIKTYADLLDQRVCDGRVVDGHGDLRPEHIYLELPPVVIDCIERCAELRRVDIADDLAVFAMECDRLGSPVTGGQICEAYVRASGDNPPAPLVDFYKGLRACERAKMAVLRAAQLGDRQQTPWFASACEYLRLSAHCLEQFAQGSV